MIRRARALALACGLLLGSCFEGQALWGERCAADRDCGPALTCHADGVCADVPACGELPLTIADMRPKVVLLLDHSESMKRCLDAPEERSACFDPDPPGPSRWDALAGVVQAAVDGLADRVDFAAIVFPSDDLPDLLKQGYACRFNAATTIAFGPTAAAAIEAAVPPDRDREPSGENPVRDAWTAARALLDDVTGDAVPPRMIVLLTDNPPNCPGGGADLETNTEKLDPSVADLVAAGAADGVPTLVVGISIQDQLAGVVPGDGQIDLVNPNLYMTGLAEAGGAPQPGATPYLHLGDSDDLPGVTGALIAAIDALTADLGRCRVRLREAPEAPELVAVGLDGRLRRDDPTCADDQAWRWPGDDRRAIELCPGACARLTAGAGVRVRYGCP